MEEIQQINGWQTSTQTDLYKQLHNKKNLPKLAKQKNTNIEQNSYVQRNKQKKQPTIIKDTKISIKKTNSALQSFYEKEKSLQSALIQKHNIKLKDKNTQRGQKSEQKKDIPKVSQNKNFRQFQCEQKIVSRQQFKKQCFKRQTIISDSYKVPFVNQYFFTQSKQDKKNKENFDNKELVFCSTMMQKQRSQRIQNIYYKSKQKNIKNQYFFALASEKLKNFVSQSPELKKQLILSNSKVKQVEIHKKLDILLRKNEKQKAKISKERIKKLNKIQTRMTANSINQVKQELKLSDIDRFKYFPTIFKTDKSSQKENSHREQNKKDKKQNQSFRKFHKRNSSQTILLNRINNRIIVMGDQNTISVDQFNDFKISEMRQNIYLTTITNTQKK